MDNKLIYGKNDTKNIVSIEIIDDTAELFIQDSEGNIETEYVPNSFWMVAKEPLSKNWIRLDGDLPFKYAKKFKTRKEFQIEKSILKNLNKDFFCLNDEKASFMAKEGYTYFKDLSPKSISVLSFDIESTGLNQDDNSKILIISNTFRKGDYLERKMFTYDEFENEAEMLLAWAQWVRDVDPSIILGHNIVSYDLPYMQYIAQRNNIQLELGRNGSPIYFNPYESKLRVDGSREQGYHKIKVYGREVVDTMFLALKYDIGKKYESYALKKIIAHEGLEVEGRQFYDADTIRDNYTNPEEWEKIKRYAEFDADDALALFDLMSPAFFYMTQTVPMSFQSIMETASGSQINNMMIRSYIQEGHSLPVSTPAKVFEGAISFGNPGIYTNCFKVDVSSLYPSIMIQYEVFDKNKDPKGNMLKIIKIFTEQRLKNKKIAEETGDPHFDALQNSQKIIINSFYGFLAAEGLIFNSPDNAALVTEHGRNILKTAIDWAESKTFKIVNADTDSITFTKSEGQDIDVDERKLLLDELNSLYPSYIRFADDGFFLKVIVLKAKNYVLYGFDRKKQKNVIKIKGSALKDAKKEKAIKEFVMEIVQSIIDEKYNYIDIYNKYITEAMDIKDMLRWSSKKTVSNKVLTNDRSNEVNIRNAFNGREISEGDKVYLYKKPDGTYCLSDEFDGIYDKIHMLKRLFDTSKVFDNIINKGTFINYSLKKNQKLLGELNVNC